MKVQRKIFINIKIKIMKNLVKSALVALTVSVFAIPASAGQYVMPPVSVQDTVIKQDTIVTKEVSLMLAQAEVTYTKIEVSVVPEKVVTAVAAKFKDYTISEAAKGSDNTYKLVIKKEDSTQTVYFSETGEFLKEEAVVSEKANLI